MKSVVLFSGGLDSTVLLYRTIQQVGKEVGAVAFNYQQRHIVELTKGVIIADRLGVNLTEVGIFSSGSAGPKAAKPLGGSSQTSNEVAVPEGHYADESMKATFVPNRNMVMLSLAASFALANRCFEVQYAAHSGDHAIYPDCRPEFVRNMNYVLSSANYQPVAVMAPFLEMTKAQIVGEGAQLGVPFELTWSCYVGGARHCGKCGTCVERREAFQLAGVKDPTEYEG